MLGNTISNLIKDLELDGNIATEHMTESINQEPDDNKPQQPSNPTPNTDPFPGQVISSNNACTIIKFPDYYKVYLKNMITTADKYISLVTLLNKLTENDTVEINLTNSPGGYVNSGMMILNAIANTSAIVVTNVKGYAYSMAAVIWGYGKLIKITNGVVMFHNIIMLGYGNVNKIKQYAENENEIFEKTLSPILDKGILTSEEYNSIKENNKDVYLYYNILKSRAEAYNVTKPELIARVSDLLSYPKG